MMLRTQFLVLRIIKVRDGKIKYLCRLDFTQQWLNLQGAKMAAPNRPAVAYVGDGAWGMSLNEMLTCVRENIPTIAVVFNNRQWGAEKKNQVQLN